MNPFEVEGELQCHWTVGSMVLCNHIISFAALLVMSSQKMGCLCLTVGKMVGQRSRVKRVATRMPLSIWMYEQCLWQRAPQSLHVLTQTIRPWSIWKMQGKGCFFVHSNKVVLLCGLIDPKIDIFKILQSEIRSQRLADLFFFPAGYFTCQGFILESPMVMMRWRSSLYFMQMRLMRPVLKVQHSSMIDLKIFTTNIDLAVCRLSHIFVWGVTQICPWECKIHTHIGGPKNIKKSSKFGWIGFLWIRFVGLSEATIIETHTQVTSPTQQIGQPKKLMQLYRIISKPLSSGIESHFRCSSIRFCISWVQLYASYMILVW